MAERYAMIIGAMKAGTTALFQRLGEHPAIHACSQKEPNFWIRDHVYGQGPQARKASLDSYRNLWEAPLKPHAKWRLEASTNYTKMPLEMSPAPYFGRGAEEFRFIYVVRNPIARIRSHYEHALAEGWIREPVHTRLHPTTLWVSNYQQQIQPYLDWRGRKSIYVISYEELCRDTGPVLDGICRFLEIQPGLLGGVLPCANRSSRYRESRMNAARRYHLDQGREVSDAELTEELDRQVMMTDDVISRVHEVLDADLRRFEALFGIDPWTGARTRKAA